MRFTDGETVWDIPYDDTPAWCTWAHEQYSHNDVVQDYIVSGFDDTWPVRIGNAEFSAYALLDKADRPYLNQLMDMEVEAFADDVRYWLEADGVYFIRDDCNKITFKRIDESDSGED